METEERYLSDGLNHFRIIFGDPCEEGILPSQRGEDPQIEKPLF